MTQVLDNFHSPPIGGMTMQTMEIIQHFRHKIDK